MSLFGRQLCSAFLKCQLSDSFTHGSRDILTLLVQQLCTFHLYINGFAFYLCTFRLYILLPIYSTANILYFSPFVWNTTVHMLYFSLKSSNRFVSSLFDTVIALLCKYSLCDDAWQCSIAYHKLWDNALLFVACTRQIFHIGYSDTSYQLRHVQGCNLLWRRHYNYTGGMQGAGWVHCHPCGSQWTCSLWAQHQLHQQGHAGDSARKIWIWLWVLVWVWWTKR